MKENRQMLETLQRLENSNEDFLNLLTSSRERMLVSFLLLL